MKNWLIKIFGGLTKEQYEAEILKNRVHLFRQGDPVYITSKKFNQITKYYLLESYNGGTCWYISQDPKSKQRSVSNGIHIDYIQFDKIEICQYCQQPLMRIHNLANQVGVDPSDSF